MKRLILRAVATRVPQCGIVGFGVLLLALAAPGPAGSALPDTPAGRALKTILAFINSGDSKGFEQYASHAFTPEFLRGLPADRMATNIVRLHETTGGLDLVSAETKPDGSLEATTRDRRSLEFKAHFLLRLSAGGQVTELRLGIKDPASNSNPYADISPGAPLEAKIAAVNRVLDAEGAAGRFSGVLLIAHKGDVLLERAVGLANRAFDVPNTVQTRFHIASQTKMFTAIAVAQLAAAGKLSFDDPIAKYLPDYPDQQVASQITIHQLLTHTSGLGDFQTKEYEKERWQLKSLAEYFRFFAGRPLRFPPGKGWGYSNAGMLLAGLIVERVSGEPYSDYICRSVFRQAGMKDSGFDSADGTIPNLAVGYTRITEDGSREGPVRTNTLALPYGSPAGGAYSTAGDMLRFTRALTGNLLLDERYTTLVTTAKEKPDGPPELFYGYGFRVVTIHGHRSYGHGGSVPGGSSELFLFPREGVVVIALANVDPPAASRIVTPICELLTAQPAESGGTVNEPASPM